MGQLPLPSAIGCPQSGRRTTPPGWRGRIIAATGPEVRADPLDLRGDRAQSVFSRESRARVNNASAEKQVRKFLGRAHALSSHVRFHLWPPTASGCATQAASSYCVAQAPSAAKAAESTRPTPPPAMGAQPPRLFGRACGRQLLAIKFRFNAWAKYSNWRHDEKSAA